MKEVKVQNSSTKVALVTGANKGIGFEISRQLAKAGLTVCLGARNTKMGEDAAATLRAEGLDVRHLDLDLDRPQTIAAAGATIEGHRRQLDVLVNNAGIADAADGPSSSVELSAVRRVMDTNFFGTLMVTQAMLPLLRAAPAARIVNLSSGLASLTLNGDPDWDFAAVKLVGYNTPRKQP